jgi:hypothetical protein
MKKKIQKGLAPTSKQLSLLKFVENSTQDNINIANSTIEKMFTFSLLLLSGCLFILDKYIISKEIRLIIITGFLLAFFISFVGLLPYEKDIDKTDVEEIEEYINKTLNHKRLFIYLSFGIIVTAILIIMIGFLLEL